MPRHKPYILTNPTGACRVFSQDADLNRDEGAIEFSDLNEAKHLMRSALEILDNSNLPHSLAAAHLSMALDALGEPAPLLGNSVL